MKFSINPAEREGLAPIANQEAKPTPVSFEELDSRVTGNKLLEARLASVFSNCISYVLSIIEYIDAEKAAQSKVVNEASIHRAKIHDETIVSINSLAGAMKEFGIDAHPLDSFRDDRSLHKRFAITAVMNWLKDNPQ